MKLFILFFFIFTITTTKSYTSSVREGSSNSNAAKPANTADKGKIPKTIPGDLGEPREVGSGNQETPPKTEPGLPPVVPPVVEPGLPPVEPVLQAGPPAPVPKALMTAAQEALILIVEALSADNINAAFFTQANRFDPYRNSPGLLSISYYTSNNLSEATVQSFASNGLLLVTVKMVKNPETNLDWNEDTRNSVFYDRWKIASDTFNAKMNFAAGGDLPAGENAPADAVHINLNFAGAGAVAAEANSLIKIMIEESNVTLNIINSNLRTAFNQVAPARPANIQEIKLRGMNGAFVILLGNANNVLRNDASDPVSLIQWLNKRNAFATTLPAPHGGAGAGIYRVGDPLNPRGILNDFTLGGDNNIAPLAQLAADIPQLAGTAYNNPNNMNNESFYGHDATLRQLQRIRFRLKEVNHGLMRASSRDVGFDRNNDLFTDSNGNVIVDHVIEQNRARAGEIMNKLRAFDSFFSSNFLGANDPEKFTNAEFISLSFANLFVFSRSIPTDYVYTRLNENGNLNIGDSKHFLLANLFLNRIATARFSVGGVYTDDNDRTVQPADVTFVLTGLVTRAS